MTNIEWLEIKMLDYSRLSSQPIEFIAWMRDVEEKWCEAEHKELLLHHAETNDLLVKGLLEAVTREMLRANEAEAKLKLIEQILRK